MHIDRFIFILVKMSQKIMLEKIHNILQINKLRNFRKSYFKTQFPFFLFLCTGDEKKNSQIYFAIKKKK